MEVLLEFTTPLSSEQLTMIAALVELNGQNSQKMISTGEKDHVGLYPKGEYPRNREYTCGAWNPLLGANCILDNDHPGRPHWGVNQSWDYVQWPQAGLELTLVKETKSEGR
jgi:hypothetical protein